jgi:hypothetical protein
LLIESSNRVCVFLLTFKITILYKSACRRAENGPPKFFPLLRVDADDRRTHGKRGMARRHEVPPRVAGNPYEDGGSYVQNRSDQKQGAGRTGESVVFDASPTGRA